MKETGLYIHIPFCKKKCIYCDFFSGGASAARWHEYISAVLGELAVRSRELILPPSTIYIGGGTPSLIPREEFIRLARGLENMGIRLRGASEFTLEVNPEDVSDEMCGIWKDEGVNRVSMGVQSFVDEELRRIGRRHDAAKAVAAMEILLSHFSNVSLDLMFGLPGQTLSSWEYSVRQALSLSPRHISAYSLMFEESTPLMVLRDKGVLSFPRDEECVDMWTLLSDSLSQRGYMQYEISNYCLPGYESVHNTRYWLGNPYLGLGPSAHSYDGEHIRRANPADLRGYIRRFASETGAGGDTNLGVSFFSEEILSAEERAEEMILTRLRMRRGLNLEEYEEKFGAEATTRILKNARSYIKNATLCLKDGWLSLTDNGIMTADNIIVALAMF